MSGAQAVREIIEASRYLVLATADAAGRPWSTPVLYRATADSHSILAKDGQPDHRVPVPLSG
jgi:nitroimidazol reductase NimA-like FMN-containing flavoprotein (pyridoxamine 5'-phosphate oxidase superfamily)